MDIDAESASDVLDSFRDLSNEIEIYLDRISCGDTEIDNLNALFRAIHSIKGNAAMIQLTCIVNYTHSMEEVVDALRAYALPASTRVAEALQLGLDRLRDLHDRELLGHEFDNLHEHELEELFSNLAKAEGSNVEEICLCVVDILGAGFLHEPVQPDEITEPIVISCVTTPEEHNKKSFDLQFFKELALQVDRQSPYWNQRTETLLGWAHKMNEMADMPINTDQLSAAVYMHDIGMSFIRNSTLSKSEDLSAEEIEEIHQHPLWGYNYIVRINGWDEAATMILEHHERIDGKGYPNGNKGHLIHDGAKILAIIDAYFSITHGRADRTNRRSIVRAISEINARKGTQFDDRWVEHFNALIKNELKNQPSTH